MLMKLSWPVLTVMAGAGGMGIGTMLLLINRQREEFANQASFVKSAVSKVREEPAIANLLGGNFKVEPASFQDGWSRIEKLQVRVQVPLKGSEDNGSLFVYAKKKDDKSKLRLFKVEMSLDKVPGKKLVLMDLGDDVLEEEEDEPVSSEDTEEDDADRRRALREEQRKERMENLVKSMITQTSTTRASKVPTSPP